MKSAGTGVAGSAPVTHRWIETNGIRMHIAEQGDGPPVVLCHGFPELWYSWRHVMPLLAAAGFRAIAPDQRGYGQTDRPAEIEAYDIHHLTGDLLGLLDALGLEQAVFVGHDWGAEVVWHLGLMAPARVRGVVGLGYPFTPRPEVSPIEALRAEAGDRFSYPLYFQAVGPADEELGRDPWRTMARFLCSLRADENEPEEQPPAEGTGVLDILCGPESLPPWLTAAEVDYYAREFARTGFTGALNWDRNLERNWQTTAHLAGTRLSVPALFIGGDRDRGTEGSLAEHVTDLRGVIFLANTGHWMQQERPEEIAAALVNFLRALEVD